MSRVLAAKGQKPRRPEANAPPDNSVTIFGDGKLQGRTFIMRYVTVLQNYLICFIILHHTLYICVQSPVFFVNEKDMATVAMRAVEDPRTLNNSTTFAASGESMFSGQACLTLGE